MPAGNLLAYPEVQAALLGGTFGVGSAASSFATQPQRTISPGLSDALSAFDPHGPIASPGAEPNQMLMQLLRGAEQQRVQQQVAPSQPAPQSPKGAYLVPNKQGQMIVRFFEEGAAPHGAQPFK